MNIVPVNNPAPFYLKNQVIEIEYTDRLYRYEQKGEKLILTYIDNPMIADDEISYVFERLQQDLSCVNLNQIRPNNPCSKEFIAVCGCDGITYNNLCEAEIYGGVTSYAYGACQN